MLSLSLGQTQCHSLRQENSRLKREKRYKRALLKAFRKQVRWRRVFYTCNVDRLRACDRLGDKKEVTLWKTHFFLASRHFDGIFGVIFNRHPGEELAGFSKLVVDHLFLYTKDTLIHTAFDLKIPVLEPFTFASAEKLPLNEVPT